MNISHLVEKIKKGDNKSFEKLYKLTEREVWFTCISFLKNETTAQDIMQETYITAFLKIQSLEKSSQIRSWLNRIAVNKCKNYLKGKGEIQLDDEIFENQAIVDERISIPEEYISDKAKSLCVPSIKITLPNGESLVTAASKGVSTAVKSSTATAVKTGAVTAVKTKVIAMACGMTLLFAGTTVGTSLLAGCKSDKVPTATTSAQTTAQATTVPAVTVPKAVKDLVDKGEIKVDKDGNITDKNGKKVEVKDGKVEVKTDDGKTVTVKVDDVKTTVSNKNNSNKGNTEKKEDTKKDNTSKTNTSDNDKKPAKPSNSSSNNQKPAKPSESSKAETTAKKYKYYKHHDAVTKYHPAVTKKHDREWIVTGTYEEPVYETRWVYVCNDCGVQLADANFRREHLLWEVDNGGRGSYHAEEQQVQVGTKTVEDGYWKEAYTEVVSKAWTETITPAYDEEVSENDHWDKKVLVRKAGWY